MTVVQLIAQLEAIPGVVNVDWRDPCAEVIDIDVQVDTMSRHVCRCIHQAELHARNWNRDLRVSLHIRAIAR